jgi:uncharacterized delta-60 repeat protein
MRTRRSLTGSTGLILILVLALSFVSGGLASQAAADDLYRVYLPMVMHWVPYIESTGILDTSFDDDGWLLTEMGLNYEWANDLAIQRDGKIVVCGGASPVLGMDFALARYNSDGSLDTSFDEDGKVFTELSGAQDECNALVLQPDGKIIAVGYVPNGTLNFAVLRYNPDGSLDTSFDEDGIVMTDFDYSEDVARSVALQSDGKIVVAGDADGLISMDFAVARYLSDGSLDPTFSEDGKLVTDFGGTDNGYDVLVQLNGKIVVAGVSLTVNRDIALARYNPDGSLDPSFDGDGQLRTDTGFSEYAYALAMQLDGKLLAVGYTTAGTRDVILARYNPDGSLDTGFGGDGLVTTDFTGEADYAYDVVLQPDGKIIIAGVGYISGDTDIILARYLPDGSLDPTFSGDGRVQTSFLTGKESAWAIALQRNGRLVVAGSTIVDTFDYSFALVRYK